MKKKRKTLAIFILSSVICLIFLIGIIVPLNKVNATASEGKVEDLSSYRHIYVSNDNVGYTSTSNTLSPFGSTLTSLSVGTTTNDGFIVDKKNVENTPVIKINNAADFMLNISFANKKKDDVLYEWNASSKKENTNIKEKYTLSSDTWGATQTGNNIQTVFANGLNLTTGEIGTGALVVQTSKDGKTWVNYDKSKYANGLYTTDVLKYYHGTTQNYTIEGSDIKEGVYVAVSFFYEVRFDYTYYYTTQERYWYQHLLFGIPIGGTHTIEHNDDKTEYRNICETYKFFVVEDNPEVVTFNNLTTADTSEIIEVAKPDSQDSIEYAAQTEQYNQFLSSVIDQIMPTMNDGDMSTTGFRINVTANPNLYVELNRNGSSYSLPSLQNENGQKYYEITQDGKYEISIKSYSHQKKLTLYVDNVNPNIAYKRYFGEKIIYNNQSYGDSFLNYSPKNDYGNKRIFDSYSEVPVFIKKVTLKLVEQINANSLPLFGVITNKSTGKVFAYDDSLVELTENGQYEILFFTNKNYYDYAILKKENISLSGDVRVYRFNFKIVDKDNDATINEQLLSTISFKDFSIVSPSDYIPKFYGVTRSSANKGKIIVAFADKESALQYAKKVAWGEIETHKNTDGTTYWLVPNLDNLTGAKIESNSGWQNARVVNEFAKKIVEEHYFDLTKTSSYLTLEQSVEEYEKEGKELTNLQFEELTKSIIVWYNEEQRAAAMVQNVYFDDNKIIKFIGKQNIAVLLKDENGLFSTVIEDTLDYKFVKDILGIDSAEIIATDSKNNTHSLKYGEGVYSQLQALDCASGLVLITEKNIYGDVTAEYYLCYIKENYQPTKIVIESDGEELNLDAQNSLKIGTRSTVLIKNIIEYIDPFTYIRIKHITNNTTTIKYYSIIDAIDLNIIDVGDYELTVIDRFGNSFTCAFQIE